MTKTIKIEDLPNFCFVPSKKLCAVHAEAATVCLDTHQHPQQVRLKITGDINEEIKLTWQNANLVAKLAWKDLQEATEFGAIAIALWVVEQFTPYKVVERAQIATGHDYYLSEKTSQQPFPRQAYLEVSGILRGKKGVINQRLREKIQQVTKRKTTTLSAYVIVVEFSHPIVKIAIR